MKAVATALAAVLVALVALTFAGCASQPIPEPARTAATPEVAAPGSSCRQSGRTTMVRGDCSIDWDGETVLVRGTVDATLGASAKGPCLRLQTKDASPLTVTPYGKFSCGGLDPALMEEAMEEAIVALEQKEQIDPARLKELLDYWKGPVDATLLKNGDLHVGGKASCHFEHWRGGRAIGPSVVCR